MLPPSLIVVAIVTIPSVIAGPISEPFQENPHGPNKTWAPPNLSQHPIGKNWPGWAGIDNLFVFGDSYTTTSFDPRLAQPNAANPLGNPISARTPYGYTAVNGPGWVQQLTEVYNRSKILTYNLAYGGATIDSAIVVPYSPTVLSVRQQVNQEFFPYYVETNKNAKWNSKNTLFCVFIGINDVGNAWRKSNATAVFDADFHIYAGLLDELYHAGARNFLLLNVPPVNLAPLTTAQGASAVSAEGAAIEGFNNRISNLAYSVEYTYANSTVFQFDTYSLFTQVLRYPAAYPQTAGYKNTTTYCVAYENGTPALDTFDPSCEIPVDQYFWLNNLHPTYHIQDVMAQLIAQELAAVPAST